MTDSGNPLLDDDDEEYEGEFSSGLPEDFALPSEFPASLPSALPEDEPISDTSELPDLSSMLGDLDLGRDRVDSGVFDESYNGDTFDVDPFSSESFEPEEDDVYSNYPVEDPLAADPIALSPFDSLVVDEPLGEDDWSAIDTPVKDISDYGTPRSNEDDYDFEGSSLDLDSIISKAIEMGASDIHLSPFDEVTLTILGEIRRLPEFGLIDPNMTVRLQQTIISNVLEQVFVEELELDTSYVVKSGKHKGRRLRLSVGKTEGNIFLVFRIIADIMPTPDELEIPKAMRDWTNLPNGLVLVNGPTGSGKSTTLSSLIQEIQFNRSEKVITIEKPIEYVYGVKPGQKAFITQREVGRDSREFSSALTSAMRQAPNIILVGEVRNRIEIDELLRAAETGHLAISTMHTTSCPATINRIRSMYEGDEQLRVLATLADNLRGMMTQSLVKSPDGRSRFAVREVLQVDKEIKEYVLQGNVQGMRDYQETRGITMEHELVRAVHAGRASIGSARSKAPNPLYFDDLLDD
jgi:twitching motility protein PilT